MFRREQYYVSVGMKLIAKQCVIAFGLCLGALPWMSGSLMAQVCQPTIGESNTIEGPIEAVVGSRWNGNTIELTFAGPINGCRTSKIHIGGIIAPEFSDLKHVCGSTNHSAEDNAAFRSASYLKSLIEFEEIVSVRNIEQEIGGSGNILAQIQRLDGTDIGQKMLAANCAMPLKLDADGIKGPHAWCSQLSTWCTQTSAPVQREARSN